MIISSETQVTQAVKKAYLTPEHRYQGKGEIASKIAHFFGELRLCDLTKDTIESFQESQHYDGRGMDLIVQAMKDARLWFPPLSDEIRHTQMSGFYVPFTKPQPFAEAETMALRDKLLSVKDGVIHLCMLAALGTAADVFDEIRFLRLEDVDLNAQTVHIRKYPHNPARTVPICGTTPKKAIAALVARAAELGCNATDYLIPYRTGEKNPHYSPSRPMSFGTMMRELHTLIRQHIITDHTITQLRPTALKKFPELAASAGYHYTDTLREDWPAPPIPPHVVEQQKRNAAAQVAAAQAMIAAEPPEPATPAPIQSAPIDEMEQMKKAAVLVRDTGISIDAAVQIVTKYAAAIERTLTGVRRSLSVTAMKPVQRATQDELPAPQESEA